PIIGRRLGRRVQIGNRMLKFRLGRRRRGKLVRPAKFRFRVLAGLFAPGIAAFAIALPIAPAAAAAATAAPVVAARLAAFARHFALRPAVCPALCLVLRAFAFCIVSSAAVWITMGLWPKFAARPDPGLVRSDVLIFRGQIAVLCNRDVLDAV